MRANFVMSGVGTGLRRNLLMTIALVLTTAISLVFLGGSILTNTFIDKFRHKYEGGLNVSIYLCGSIKTATCSHVATNAEKAALQTRLSADPLIVSTDFISKQEAYARNRNFLGADAAKFLTPDDFPDSYVLKLKNVGRDYPTISQNYRSQPGVEVVQNEDESLKTILKLFNSARISAFVFAVLVLISAIILMAITIQVAASQRRNETNIMRLVGASRWMTQLPFVIEAIIGALVGAVLAGVGLWVGKLVMLNGIFRDQVQRSVLPDLSFGEVLTAASVSLAVGIILATVTAYVTLRAYVRL